MNLFTESCENIPTKAILLQKWNSTTYNTSIDIGASYAISASPQGIRLIGAGIGRAIAQTVHGFKGIRFKMVSGYTVNGGGMFSFEDGSGTYHLNVGWNASTGLFTLNRGGFFGNGGTNIATSSSGALNGSVHYYEFEWVIDASAGVFKMWVDGTLVINFAGNTANTANHYVAVFHVYAGGNGMTAYFGDVYVNDNSGTVDNGILGDTTIRGYAVASAGAHADFSRGGVDTGSNSGQLAKLFADVASINNDFTVGHRDDFVMAAIAGSPTIKGARLWAYAQKDNTGARSLALTINSGGTDDIGANQSLSGPGYGWYSRDASVDPHTSALFASATALNAIKAGYKLTV